MKHKTGLNRLSRVTIPGKLGKLLTLNSYVGKLYFLNSTYSLYWIAKLNEDGLQTLSSPCIAI